MPFPRHHCAQNIIGLYLIGSDIPAGRYRIRASNENAHQYLINMNFCHCKAQFAWGIVSGVRQGKEGTMLTQDPSGTPTSRMLGPYGLFKQESPAGAQGGQRAKRTLTKGFVANFAQEVMKGQLPMPVEGIRRPGSRTIRPQ